VRKGLAPIRSTVSLEEWKVAFSNPTDYDVFMGRYSSKLAPLFASFAAVDSTMRVLEVGSGPGALLQELATIVDEKQLSAVEPSRRFVQECRHRVPGAEVREGSADQLPWDDNTFDAALAQLVLHLIADPAAAVIEMSRVVRPGGVIAACIWDMSGAMQMLSTFWDAALALDPSAPAEATRTRLGAPQDLQHLWSSLGISDVTVGSLDVEARYEHFDDFWLPFTLGVGPSGAYCTSLEPHGQAALRSECHRRLGRPRSQFSLRARAWAAKGQVVP
jgi:SAM-dependent methyltransferase